MNNLFDLINSCNDLILLISLREDSIKCHNYKLADIINIRIMSLRLIKK